MFLLTKTGVFVDKDKRQLVENQCSQWAPLKTINSEKISSQEIKPCALVTAGNIFLKNETLKIS